MMKLGFVALGICLIGLPAYCRAANNCAWINEATVSGLLGVQAIGVVTKTVSGQPAACTFTQQSERGKRTFLVSVEINGDAHARLSAMAQSCGADAAPLRAIGNEAIICAANHRKDQMGERVIGRVRDQVFMIDIDTTFKNDPILTRDELKSRIYTAAEQISGNLF
jgi:hypothetical protein